MTDTEKLKREAQEKLSELELRAQGGRFPSIWLAGYVIRGQLEICERLDKLIELQKEQITEENR